MAVLDVAALAGVEARLEAALWERSAAHGRRLRDDLADDARRLVGRQDAAVEDFLKF